MFGFPMYIAGWQTGPFPARSRLLPQEEAYQPQEVPMIDWLMRCATVFFYTTFFWQLLQ